MHLKVGTLLKGGTYRVEKVLGQGGFGITYLAEQSGLNRKVAVKEFFIKEHCNRDADTSFVSVPSYGSRDLVDRFMGKFIKEAQTIALMDNHHIITIHDVFEENGTAYYVMEYLSCGSLSEKIPCEGLPESEAVSYIRQIADALSYIHQKNILHLDIKPSNILFRKADEAVLIDFGISKHYDDEEGSQTSSTPVGVSEGYAPTEQYEREGVSSFAASTDIYSLGATLYCLLSGHRPPKASIVLNDGLPPLPSSVSDPVRNAVEKAMSPRRKDRPLTVEAFLELLATPVVTVSDEETKIVDSSSEEPESSSSDNSGTLGSGSGSKVIGLSRIMKWIWAWTAGLLIVAVVALLLLRLLGYERLEISSSYSNGVLQVGEVEYPMVYVSGGSFDMGATSEQGSDAYDWEKPFHRVTLSSYSIGMYEVTQELWEAVMGGNPSHFKGSRRPVECVSWKDCRNFIRKLNAMTGQNFRLPTEAEWEFAARGGNSNRGCKYSGSNTIGNVAWYEDNSGGETHDVGGKSPNELGIYDMSGNVREWCYDRFGAYSSSSQTNPKGPVFGSYRVDRGGGWNYSAWSCRVSNRNRYTPGDRRGGIGFRLCL